MSSRCSCTVVRLSTYKGFVLSMSWVINENVYNWKAVRLDWGRRGLREVRFPRMVAGLILNGGLLPRLTNHFLGIPLLEIFPPWLLFIHALSLLFSSLVLNIVPEWRWISQHDSMYVTAEISAVRIIVNPVVVSNSKKFIQFTLLYCLLLGRIFWGEITHKTPWARRPNNRA